jgi:hypothetical protein
MSDETGAVLINLRQLHDAMVADLSAHYLGRVPTICAYDPFPARDDQTPQPVVTPAILLELESIAPGEDDGTDRQALLLTFSAHCVLSQRTEAMQLELREFAADLLSHLRHQRWGLAGALQEPTALAAAAGEFSPGLEGFDSWRATWEQTVYVGASVWAGGVAPTAVWLGQAPLIGAAHEDDYVLIAGTAQ